MPGRWRRVWPGWRTWARAALAPEDRASVEALERRSAALAREADQAWRAWQQALRGRRAVRRQIERILRRGL